MSYPITEKIINAVREFVAFADKEKDISEKAGNDADFLFRGL